jgi:hypothetical protein
MVGYSLTMTPLLCILHFPPGTIDDDLEEKDDRLGRRNESNSDDGHKPPWRNQPIRYVYDAAAERTQERLHQLQLVNGVH